jgi:hypothetical protein
MSTDSVESSNSAYTRTHHIYIHTHTPHTHTHTHTHTHRKEQQFHGKAGLILRNDSKRAKRREHVNQDHVLPSALVSATIFS